MEEAFSQPEKTLKAYQCTWIAHLFQDKFAESCRVDSTFTCQVYQGKWNGVPDFTRLTPARTGTTQGISLAGMPAGEEHFGLVFEGKMKAAQNCQLSLRMTANDHARLLVDGSVALQSHGAEAMALIPIEAGEHKIRVEFQQGDGEPVLDTWLTAIPNRPIPQVEMVYLMALETCPLHYGLCTEIGDWGRREKTTDGGFWERYANSITQAYPGYHEMAWNLLAPYPGAGLNELCTPDQMVSWVIDCHKKLATGRFNAKWGGALPWYAISPVMACQWKLAKQDETAGLRLFEALLQLHANDMSPYLSATLEWGNLVFGKNPSTAGKFHELMRACLESCSDKTDKTLLRNRLIALVRDAAAREDIVAFQRFHDLIISIYKPDAASETGLTPEQLATRPKFTPPSGTLLSEHGLIKASSYAGNDRPLSHPNILGDNKTGGLIVTNPESAPWVMVILPGVCDIYNILVINAWESEATQASVVPLMVSISETGQKWTQVTTIANPWSFWKIRTNAPIPKAKYIKFERKPGARQESFQFRQIQVFGKPLY
jgi:hypothetical protein